MPFTLPFHARNGSQQAEHNESSSELLSGDSARSRLPISTISTQAIASPGTPLDKTNASTNPVIEAELMNSRDFSQYLFLKGEKVNARFGKENDTLLHSAAREGDAKTAAWLIKGGADTEAENKSRATPLHLAALQGHLDVVKLLLIEYKANAEATTQNGSTPLHIAAQYGHLGLVEFFLEQKANIEAAVSGYTALYIACHEGHLDVVKLLVKQKANIEAAGLDGVTPLSIAAGKGHLDVVKLLIEHKANIEAAGHIGGRPVHMAAQGDHLDVVRFLLEHKANVEAAYNGGDTPLFVAAYLGHLNVARLLLEHKANVESARWLHTVVYCSF